MEHKGAAEPVGASRGQRAAADHSLTAAKERLSPNAFRALIIVRPRERRAASVGAAERRPEPISKHALFSRAHKHARAVESGCRCAEYSQTDAIRSEYVHVYIYIHTSIYLCIL